MKKIIVLCAILLGFSISESFALEHIRYVFIIGGAHKGERIVKFKKEDLYTKHSWEIFAIEANPYVIDEIPRAQDTTIINKAIWIKDGSIEFYFSPASDTLSSVYKESYAQNNIPISIESIQFGQWLKRNFAKNDYIMASLDIEGSEYDVLNQMYADNTIQYIDLLYVEFHPRIGGISENDIADLLAKIKKSGIAVERVEM